ncbi:MAG TPA: hypothetical protein VJH04_00640 [archaeon]|nr:hypothetical protein [archaeon]
MATRLGLDAAGQIRRPEGTGKWFVKSRAMSALKRAGYKITGEEVGRGYVWTATKGNDKVEFARGITSNSSIGWIFDTYTKDQDAIDIAYRFGAVVYEHSWNKLNESIAGVK